MSDDDDDQGTLTIHSKTFHDILIEELPDSKAPYSEHAQRPEAFQYWWKMIHSVFHVPDPASFPQTTFSDDEREVLAQYVETCRDLASMTVLSHQGGITFHMGAEGEGDVERNLPPKDATRGALVTLRQLEKPDEHASFSKVWKIVGRRLNEIDPASAKRHNRYRLIQSKLMNGYLRKMMDVLSCTLNGWDTKLAMSLYHSGKPEAVINQAMYTGHVHWNRERAAAGAMKQNDDHVWAGMFEADLYDSVLQLSHWKFVYAEFIERQLQLPS